MSCPTKLQPAPDSKRSLPARLPAGPDDSSAAFTAYGERMRVVVAGARDAGVMAAGPIARARDAEIVLPARDPGGGPAWVGELRFRAQRTRPERGAEGLL